MVISALESLDESESTLVDSAAKESLVGAATEVTSVSRVSSADAQRAILAYIITFPDIYTVSSLTRLNVARN